MIEEADLQIRTHLQQTNRLLPGQIHMNGMRQSSADRSMSTTSSQNGEEQQDLEDDIALGGGREQSRDASSINLDLGREVADLKNSFMYVSHQLTRIMKQLGVQQCNCTPCSARHCQMNGVKKEEPTSMLMQQMKPLNQMPPRPMATIGQSYSNQPGGGKIMPGPAEKKMVAEYARVHGAVAAARKFGVPPPVATYYTRKDSANAMLQAQLGPHMAQSMNQLNQMNQMSQQSTPTTPTLAHSFSGNFSGSPGPSSEGEGDEKSGPPVLQPATPNHQVTTPQSVPQSPLFPQSMMEMMKMNAAHSTGSPGFLRGRGRGRPKLIGDELDADLVEYMVSYKQNEPGQHMTASHALAVARSYILEKAPGLLEEQGGHVKLKLTWAMKLVTRIAERQKELELGLPAGSLSNMGRVHLNNLPGGNFMADMVAQNILSQHMMVGMNGSSKHNSSQENEEPVAGAPEILNVKELPLNFLSDLMAAANSEGVVEGQLPDDEEEKDLSGDIEMPTISN